MGLMKGSGHLLFAVLLILARVAASSGQQPKVTIDHGECEYWARDDFDDLKLAEVLGPGNAEYLDTRTRSLTPCSPEKGDCQPGG